MAQLNSEFEHNTDFNIETRSITIGAEVASRIKDKELVILKTDGKQMHPLMRDGKFTGEYVFFVGVVERK